jgi:hypothetical protein
MRLTTVFPDDTGFTDGQGTNVVLDARSCDGETSRYFPPRVTHASMPDVRSERHLREGCQLFPGRHYLRRKKLEADEREAIVKGTLVTHAATGREWRHDRNLAFVKCASEPRVNETSNRNEVDDR